MYMYMYMICMYVRMYVWAWVLGEKLQPSWETHDVRLAHRIGFKKQEIFLQSVVVCICSRHSHFFAIVCIFWPRPAIWTVFFLLLLFLPLVACCFCFCTACVLPSFLPSFLPRRQQSLEKENTLDKTKHRKWGSPWICTCANEVCHHWNSNDAAPEIINSLFFGGPQQLP